MQPVSVDHYENFPVASLLCPARLRPAVTAIYWFARTADDLADEGDAPPEQRLALLADYRRDLECAARGIAVSTRWPKVFGPLARTMASHRMPVAAMRDLLSAFEQDVVQHDHADRAALLDYCRRSANPVGRLLLHLHGVCDEASLAQSDAICTALQLINFWQDLGLDLQRGRSYLAQADLVRFGLDAAALRRGEDSPALHALLVELVDWARQLMQSGAPLVHTLPGRAGWELRLVVQGGLRILEKIERGGYGVLKNRPRLRWFDAPLLLSRALCMRPPAAALESRTT